jgi:hypothetical protein
MDLLKDNIYKHGKCNNNMKRLILVLSLVLLLVLPILTFVSAEQINSPTQNYNKIYLNPFYTNNIAQYQKYNFNVTINPQDKIGKVISALLTFHTYARPTVAYNLTVNNQWCNNRWYNISTTDAGAAMADLFFDCSNIITKAGTYNISLWSNKAGGATTAWLDLVYSSNPAGAVTIHGTEYSNDHTAKVWLQLLDADGEYVIDGVCYADIYTPDGEELIEQSLMLNMEHDGIYYLDYALTDLIEGVYPAIARCYYEAIQTYNYALNTFVINGTLNAGTVANTYAIDTVVLRFKEKDVKVPAPERDRISVGLNFTNGSICNVTEELLTGISIRTVAKFDSAVNDDITLSVWNYTSSSWVNLPNKILEGAAFRDVSNSFSTNNLTKLGLVNGSGSNLVLRYTDTELADAGGESNLDIDYATVSCEQLANPEWQEVKGSSEIHITIPEGTEQYIEESLCGELTIDGFESACAEFINNLSYWNRTWGYIYDKVTYYNSYNSEISDTAIYTTLLGQDCTSILDITETRNGTTSSIIDETIMSLGDKENCIIKIPINFTSDENDFYIEIYQDNYMKWEIQRIDDLINYYRMPIEDFCADVETQSNEEFVIPLDDLGGETDISQIYIDNPIYLGCYRTLDDLYWYDYYYNESLEINVSEAYESLLYTSRYYYEELKDGSDAVMGITGQNVLIHVNTLCGESSNFPNQYSCSKIMPPDAYFTSQEGYLIQNLTVINDFNTTSSGYYSYSTAPSIDCSAVMEVIKDNGTRTDIYDEVIFNAGDEGSCNMNIPINNVEGVPSYQIELYIENYILWDIYWARDNVNSWNDTINPFCEDIATNRSISYTLPINSSLESYRNDSELYFCYRAMDDLYWWYFFYDELTTSNFTMGGELGSYRYESEFFWQRILNDYNIVQTYNRNLTQTLILDEVLSLRDTLANRVWNYNGSRNLTYYGEGSDPQAISDYVWNATNRSLTYTDNIGYAIWNYSGALGSNIIQTLVNNTWSYTGAVSNELMANIGNATWTYTGNSTYMVNTIVNSTWEYTGGRYTHGEIIEG